MLKKLLKYDLPYMFRYLAIFYTIGLVFALLTRLFLPTEQSFLLHLLGKICSGVVLSMVINIIINSTLRLWVRFKGHLYGDESYLTHTLPVKKSTHYLAKAFSGMVGLFVSVGVIGITLFVAYYSKENFELLKSILLPMEQLYNSSWAVILLAVLLILFLEFANVLQCGFTGIILGHRRNRAKAGLSVLFGGLAFMVNQTLVVAAMGVAALFSQNFRNLFATQQMITVETIKQVIILSIIVYTLLAVAMAAVNIKLLNKGVNVE
ncbi:MAG: hypothetical protein IKM39_00900 [Clostridia bacterium]|nr:hypothetical protein [Clostridia bacterium]